MDNVSCSGRMWKTLNRRNVNCLDNMILGKSSLVLEAPPCFPDRFAAFPLSEPAGERVQAPLDKTLASWLKELAVLGATSRYIGDVSSLLVRVEVQPEHLSLLGVDQVLS